MRTITGLEELKAAEGEELGVSGWHQVGQDDIAHTAAFLASEGAGFVSGQVIYVAGGPVD